MARIKFSKHILFALTTSIILFIIPFFWLKPGEIDLGGDSSRLYFYDPLTYLRGSVLYTISASSFGFENLNYSNLPFISLILILKSVLTSTIIASAIYGFSLSAAFVFCYLTIKELINKEKDWYAPLVGALVYVLSPATIDGWKHVLITYNQIFLNPLIFYLLLKYFKTSKLYMLLTVVFLTFIFSVNFSVGAAPPFFAFYPLSILFLILYAKFVLKRKIIVKHLLFGLFLFLGVQSFHIIPQIIDIIYKENVISEAVFSYEAMINRGLNYFLAIAPNIKASINLMALPQMKDLHSFSKVFLLFPFVIVSAFFFNRRNSHVSHSKTIILTGFFFLIILLFASANVTDTWLTIYKELFKIPGFSMFRNFYGQWQLAYIFFYSILFGQALSILLDRLKKTHGFLLVSVLVLILAVNANPLIKGEYARENLWQSNNIPSIIEMDPAYEELLSYIRSLPAEGRVLILPLSDQGNQVVAGKNGGAYIGPSSISYLTGKKDFAGFDEFEDYRNLILKLVRNNELEALKRLLATLNVRYVFYNADPVVYDEFPKFPYEFTRSFMPKTQSSYKEFIQNLNLREIKNINNKFFVYELPYTYFLPQINIAKKLINFNKSIAEIEKPLSILENYNRIAIYDRGGANRYGVSPINDVAFDEFLTDVSEENSFSNVTESTRVSTFGFPHVSWSVKSLIYPFILMREKHELSKYKILDQTHIDRRIFFAEKRIAELQKWANDYWVLGNIKETEHLRMSWREPNVVEAIVLGKYNFWEVSLFQYKKALGELIDKIEDESRSNPSFAANKNRLRKAINRDRDILYRLIQSNEKLSDPQKEYLIKLSVQMFSSITDRLLFQLPSLEKIYYDLSQLEEGLYDIYIDKKSFENYDLKKLHAVINNKEISFDRLQQDGNWFKILNASFKDSQGNAFSLMVPEIDLISKSIWKSVETAEFLTTSTNLTISDTASEKNGLFIEIRGMSEQSYYTISFDYYTKGKGFKMLLFDRAKDLRVGETTNIEEAELRSEEWKTYRFVIRSSDVPSSTFLQIVKLSNNHILNRIESEKEGTKTDIRNLSIVQIPTPKIVLRKVSPGNDQDKKIPQIIFTRINPTKYELKVQNATDPYTLVLVNQFNRKWKLVDPTVPEAHDLFSKFSRFIATMTLSIQGHKNDNDGKDELSYFDGDIREIQKKDTFLNKKTFETLGKDEIAQYKHFPVNGYSNAWYIEPADVRNKTDYTLIIEFSAQKQFYGYLLLSMFIAAFTFLAIPFSLLKSLKK